MINLLSHPVVLRIGFLIALVGLLLPSEADASNLPQCTGDYFDNCQGTFTWPVKTKFTRESEGGHFEIIYRIDFIKNMILTSERYYPKEPKEVFGQGSNQTFSIENRQYENCMIVDDKNWECQPYGVNEGTLIMTQGRLIYYVWNVPMYYIKSYYIDF